MTTTNTYSCDLCQATSQDEREMTMMVFEVRLGSGAAGPLFGHGIGGLIEWRHVCGPCTVKMAEALFDKKCLSRNPSQNFGAHLFSEMLCTQDGVQL